MGKSKYTLTETQINKRIKEGRGAGQLSNYKPWLYVNEVPSEGRSQRVFSHLTGRVHHVLSDLELQSFLYKEADYLLTVKGNQGQLHDAVKQVFAGKAHKDTAAQSLEKNRGRLEYREFQVCDASELPEKLKAAWPALTTLGMATTYRVEKNKRAVLEQRYFISSAALSAERLSSAVREHWSIENQLHWVLDVSLGEDACQIYRGNAATNLATMRHFGLNMLRAEKRKMSIRRKQRQALMNEAYLDAVLEAGMNVVVK